MLPFYQTAFMGLTSSEEIGLAASFVWSPDLLNLLLDCFWTTGVFCSSLTSETAGLESILD